ncbi:glycosyltransferase family 2 protein [Paenibacillus sp. NPDC056722]|uniref:glycosyltransferase family 2 protein n=1 Tax=Paenibacillus sp. NPDC056722 TaxID=3345924 RepID=UPI00369FB3B0
MNPVENEKVSIIIPVYNTKNYVRRAIESILNQSYKNIELIIVDDGSTDGSSAICDEYKQKDSRINVIHQKNSGVSAARNNGIINATGQYIQFVDSDDEIKSDMIKTMVDAIEKNKSDLVICGYSVIGKQVFNSATRLYDATEFLVESYLNPDISSLVLSSWNMIFKSSILKDNNLRFDPSYVMGEDGLFTLDYLNKCEKVLTINKVFYNYYVFTPEERISAISYFSPDLYELRMEYFKRLFLNAKEKFNTDQKEMLLQTYYDKLVGGLIRLGAYSKYFSNDEIIQRLSVVVSDELVVEAGKSYKRKGKEDSVLVPLFMKNKNLESLKEEIERKGIYYIDKYGERESVRSIFAKKSI